MCAMNSKEKSPSMSLRRLAMAQEKKTRRGFKAPPPGIGLNSLRVVQVNGGGPLSRMRTEYGYFENGLGARTQRGPL